ncbi:hypothetical protein Cgig2_009349 [Carnegiea gigantea]|uniref:Uncharacterized protein n=1 Tax=Carnegiea gigantea TaxID=171969 RepID=A0A9Q1JGU4_9CARY|nr:hypothetical protein Cgig2_009349 [Carnegiea gigantea]
MREKKKLYLAFKNSNGGYKARVKLTFDSPNPKHRRHAGAPLDLHGESPSHMLIDGGPWVLEGSELAKRKKKKGGPSKSLSELDEFRNSFIDIGLYNLGMDSTANLDVVDNLLERLGPCATKLQQWNLDTFAYLGRRITQLEQQFGTQSDALSHKQLLQQIRKCRQPTMFMVIMPKPSHMPSVRVFDLIDHDNACWRGNLIREYFLPVDAEVILTVPLCASWSHDKLIWRYSPDGAFSVQSAYHMIMMSRTLGSEGSSHAKHDEWKAHWKLCLPPRVNSLPGGFARGFCQQIVTWLTVCLRGT